MARPRIFISSTFYDLKHVRYDLESFIKSMGYDSIMNDKGQVPYSSTQPLQDNCYDEVSRADILVGIIGGRFGSDSDDESYSVSMKEIKTAIKNNKQVFIFVEKSVLNEHQIYQLNKDSSDIKFAHVDNIKIHNFIEEINELKINNAMIAFDSATDITNFLKEQFAGLFQWLLQDKATLTEQTTLYDLNDTIKELKETALNIKEENKRFTNKFDGSMFATKLVPRLIFKKIGIKQASIFVPNRDALFEVLKAMNFFEIEQDNPEYYVFQRNFDNNMAQILRMNLELFDNNEIKDKRKTNELESLIAFEEVELVSTDDELPF